MPKKTIISSIILSVLLLSSSTLIAAENSNPDLSVSVASHNAGALNLYGEIIGTFNSPDGTVVGATLSGENVTFSIPMEKNSKQYLHFAFMHAESASEGWFFAPGSENGIELSGIMEKNGKPVDITQYISLFRAPSANLIEKITTDNGTLRYGNADKFLMVTLDQKNNFFVINIKNISDKEFTTPISSGVWNVTGVAEKSFDHIPSSALSKLATMGHRDDIYQMIKDK